MASLETIFLDSDEEVDDLPPQQQQPVVAARASPSTPPLFRGETHTSDDEDDEDDEEDELKPNEVEEVAGGIPYSPVFDRFPLKTRGTMTINELHRLLERNQINLSPPYQRDFVWVEQQQKDLVNSIFRHLHIPDLLFNVALDDVQIDEANAADREEWTVMDGRQRITSIRGFLRGEFSIRDRDNVPFWYRAPPGSTHKVLSPAAKERFGAITLGYEAFSNLTEEQQQDQFFVVQRGKVLNEPEKLRGIKGGWATWGQQLVAKYCDSRTTTSFTPRIAVLTRNNDQITMVRAANFLTTPLESTKWLTNIGIGKLLASAAPSPQVQSHVHETLDRLQRLTLVLRTLNTNTIQPTIKHAVPGTPYPHQVFRPTAKRVVSPLEFPWLPVVVDRWAHLSDGELLEIMERLMKHMSDKAGGTLLGNPRNFELMQTWTHTFDPTTLTHKYRNDGSFRPLPDDGRPRSPTPNPPPARTPTPPPAPSPRQRSPSLGLPPPPPPPLPPPTVGRQRAHILTPQPGSSGQRTPQAGPSGSGTGRSSSRSSSSAAAVGDGEGERVVKGEPGAVGVKRERVEEESAEQAAKRAKKEGRNDPVQKAARKAKRAAKRSREKEAAERLALDQRGGGAGGAGGASSAAASAPVVKEEEEEEEGKRTVAVS